MCAVSGGVNFNLLLNTIGDEMEIILTILLTPIVLLIGVILLSKGECYYCGYKFNDTDIVWNKDGNKCCYKCTMKEFEK